MAASTAARTGLPAVLVVIAGALLLAGAPRANSAGEPGSRRGVQGTPASQARMERVLGERVDRLARRADAGKPHREPLFAASLIAANANRGEALLEPANRALAERMLERLAGMGLTAVTFDVNFPILDPQYWAAVHAPAGRCAELEAFYGALADKARALHLQVIVESSQVFTSEAYSSLPVKDYYRGLDLATFEARRLDMLKRIATIMRPAWFTVSEESDTMAAVTGLPVDDPQVLVPMVGRAVQELRGLGIPGMKVGAGFGTWHPRWRTLAEGFLGRADADFLNLHVYPVAERFDDVLFEAAKLARARGKAVVIGEAWLYKTLGGENLNGAFDATAFNRDACACWADLDARFLAAIARVARTEGYAYVSPFWSNLLFGYAECPAGQGADPPADVKRRANRVAAEAIRGDGLSPSGRAWSAAARVAGAK